MTVIRRFLNRTVPESVSNGKISGKKPQVN